MFHEDEFIELAIKYLDVCTRKRNILMNKRILEPLTQEEEESLRMYNEYSHKLRIKISEITLSKRVNKAGSRGIDKTMTDEVCCRCGDVDDNHRTLKMYCFYDMRELDIPFALERAITHAADEDGYEYDLYTLRVCKKCRSEWMLAIKHWFENIPEEKSCGSGIFVSQFGAIIEVTEEEFHNRMRSNETGGEPKK